MSYGKNVCSNGECVSQMPPSTLIFPIGNVMWIIPGKYVNKNDFGEYETERHSHNFKEVVLLDMKLTYSPTHNTSLGIWKFKVADRYIPRNEMWFEQNEFYFRYY